MDKNKKNQKWFKPITRVLLGFFFSHLPLDAGRPITNHTRRECSNKYL